MKMILTKNGFWLVLTAMLFVAITNMDLIKPFNLIQGICFGFIYISTCIFYYNLHDLYKEEVRKNER
jgi:hypothetical protein